MSSMTIATSSAVGWTTVVKAPHVVDCSLYSNEWENPEELFDIHVDNSIFTMGTSGRADEVISRMYVTEKLTKWEWETFATISSFCRPNGTFLDVGSWVGHFTLFAATLCGRVYAFDPDPVAFKILNRNIYANPPLRRKISAFNIAISDRTGFVKLKNKLNGTFDHSGWAIPRISPVTACRRYFLATPQAHGTRRPRL
jgi:SAM-dependent methyltransferase